MPNRWLAVAFGLAALAITAIFGVYAAEETMRVAGEEGQIRISVIGSIGLAALGVVFAIFAMLRTLLNRGHILWYIAAILHGAAAVAYASQVRDWGLGALAVVTLLELFAARQMRRTADQIERKGPPAAEVS